MKYALDFWYQAYPTCPYCRTRQDRCEWNHSDDHLTKAQCEKCSKYFLCTTRATVRFDSIGDCEKNGDMPHQLMIESSQKYTCQNCHLHLYDWQLPDGKYPRIKEGEYVIIEEKQSEGGG